MPRRSLILITIMIMIVLALSLAQAQGSGNQASLKPYACAFDASSSTATIRAALVDATGRPLPPASASLAIRADGRALPADQVRIETPTPRPPLQMVLVLDTTDTVPIREVVNAISNRLAPRLEVQDQVALITFSEEVAPVTQFYTDKNRLINEHMIDLLALDGDNRLYEAIAAALRAFPFGSQERRVVLILTDSGRRRIAQTDTPSLIALAQAEGVQVYPIGFFTRDKPDLDELQALANGSSGLAWFYAQERNDRASIQIALEGYLEQFVNALQGEIRVLVRTDGLTPDVEGGKAFDLTLTLPSGALLTARATCPLEVVRHSISFDEPPAQDSPILGALDLVVSVDSPLPPTERRIIFRVNGEIVQNSVREVYRFSAADFAPGSYRISAELWNSDSIVLASSADEVRLFAQQSLTLEVRNADVSQPISGPLTLAARAAAPFALPAVAFLASPEADPQLEDVLGRAAFSAEGLAELNIPDLRALAQERFSLADDEGLIVRARIEGLNANEPPLALSAPLTLRLGLLAPAPSPSETPPAPPALVISLPEPDWRVPAALAVGLLALNLLLALWIRRKRIQQLIDNPDSSEMSPRVMALTVYRGGVKQPHPLTQKTVTIGRGSSNDINLGEDARISRHHGVVMWRRGHWYYSNRKGRAWARINGRRYRGFVRVRLEAVSEIEIGPMLLLFHSNAQQDLADFVQTNL